MPAYRGKEKSIIRTFFSQNKQKVIDRLKEERRFRETLTYPQFCQATISVAKESPIPEIDTIFSNARLQEDENQAIIKKIYDGVKEQLPYQSTIRMAFTPPIKNHGGILANQTREAAAEIERVTGLSKENAMLATNPNGLHTSRVVPSFSADFPTLHITVHSGNGKEGTPDRRKCDGVKKITFFYEQVTFKEMTEPVYYFVAAGTHVNSSTYCITHAVPYEAAGFKVGEKVTFS